jgi:D-cysteine desulfhydrase/L-cysteate sulfo-lyase
MTGVALGGNKIRQLDYILVEAKKQNADAVITTCGIQSNWSRQTVALATKMGMKAVLVLRTAQFKNKPKVYDGNILLDYILGADIKVVKMRINQNPAEFLEAEAEKLRKKGLKPFVMGLEASVSPLATVAYVDAMREILEQSQWSGIDLEKIVVAAGAGPTQAGLILGAKMLGMKAKVVGVNVGAYSKDFLEKTIIESSEGAAKLLGISTRVTRQDIRIDEEYAGRDYGIPTKESLEAVRTVAQTDAVILDPVYTSKAMSGLFGMVKRGELKKDESVCFIHTGGIPALFAYKQHFQPK